MEEQRELPECGAVLPADHCLRTTTDGAQGVGIQKFRPGGFDDQRAEQAMLLVHVGKQMVMEKDGVQLLIGKEPLDQGFEIWLWSGGTMNTNRYVVKSLELHLFFGRIMKEHAFFLRAGFTSADPSFSERAAFYQKSFEALLRDTVTLAGGVVGRDVIESGEVVTEFTAWTEKQTECFTGIPIAREITNHSLCLRPGDCQSNLTQMQEKVHRLNRTALKLLAGLIDFKETILKRVLRCEMFTLNYPLLIEHILREAKLYRKFVEMLERDGDLSECSMKENECFWNQIMMEHALFIRGLLDPCEAELFCTADNFAKEYGKLLENSKNAAQKAQMAESLSETIRFRDFKIAGVQGIQQCKICSIILPLLADHVLREANHYIRILKH